MPEGTGPGPGDVAFGHVPDWMNSGFFEGALREGLGDADLRVTRSEVRSATGKGENYVSVVYAATVHSAPRSEDEEEARHDLIIKCLPSNKARQLMSNNAEFFRKEVDMYNIVFPEFTRLARGSGVILPWPSHYATLLDGQRDYLVLDDLRVAGYTMKERLKGLDAAHLGAALGALAKFHAFSYALKLMEPEVYKAKVYDPFPETMFSLKTEEMMSVFISNTYVEIANAIREWDDSRYDVVADWLERTKGTVLRTINALLSPDEPGAVLNHGDYWVNNMLFRYPASQEGGAREPDDVKLLDFQISRVCSPAGDLSYLMATSASKAVRAAHWERLLRTSYYETFWDTLEALGAKSLAEAQPGGVFSWPWLKSEMRRYLPFAMITSVTTTTVVLAETADAPDLDTMTEEQLMGQDQSNPFSHLAKAKPYQEMLRGLLDEFIDQGLFQ